MHQNLIEVPHSLFTTHNIDDDVFLALPLPSERYSHPPSEFIDPLFIQRQECTGGGQNELSTVRNVNDAESVGKIFNGLFEQPIILSHRSGFRVTQRGNNAY